MSKLLGLMFVFLSSSVLAMDLPVVQCTLDSLAQGRTHVKFVLWNNDAKAKFSNAAEGNVGDFRYFIGAIGDVGNDGKLIFKTEIHLENTKIMTGLLSAEGSDTVALGWYGENGFKLLNISCKVSM